MATGLPASGHLLVAFSGPALLGAAGAALQLGLTARLMVEAPRPLSPSRPGRDVRATIAGGARLSLCDALLVRLLIGIAAQGLLLTTIELLTPVRLADLTGSASAGASLYGLLATLAFFGVAAGATLGPRLDRAVSSPVRSLVVLALVGGLLVGAFAAAPALGIAVAAFVLVYVALGMMGPVRQDLLHSRVRPHDRSTVLSVESLVLQAGGVIGFVGLGALAAAVGVTAATLVAAAVVAGSALAYAGMRQVGVETCSSQAAAAADRRAS